MIATVKYQVATYSGEVQVNCNESVNALLSVQCGKLNENDR